MFLIVKYTSGIRNVRNLVLMDLSCKGYTRKVQYSGENQSQVFTAGVWGSFNNIHLTCLSQPKMIRKS